MFGSDQSSICKFDYQLTFDKPILQIICACERELELLWSRWLGRVFKPCRWKSPGQAPRHLIKTTPSPSPFPTVGAALCRDSGNLAA